MKNMTQYIDPVDDLVSYAKIPVHGVYSARAWREAAYSGSHRVYHCRLLENLNSYRAAFSAASQYPSSKTDGADRDEGRKASLVSGSESPSKKASPSRGRKKAASSSRSTLEVEIKCLMECCMAINTARSLTVYLLAKYGEWEQYLLLPTPEKEDDRFADDYLVTEMLSKNPNLPNVSFDKEEAAKQKWLECEASNASYNQLLRAVSDGSASLLPELEHLVKGARYWVRRILGPLSKRALSEIESSMRFGPGATSSVRGKWVLPSRKNVASFDATPKLYPFVRSLIPMVSGQYISHDIGLRASNEVIFVPKTAKTHRAIAIEPHANIYAQLGVGAYMRKQFRLLTGIDLDDQADRNRDRLFDSHIATIDLSSASDSISLELVNMLVDDEWGYLLDILRSEYSQFGNVDVKLEKFSSMGNGFTFELETIIFWAICAACGAYEAYVFGDDIIVDQHNGQKVVSGLQSLGFTVNAKKTFLSGSFFESCGVDVWRGKDIRPFYLKGTYENTELAIVRILNKVRLYAHRRNCLLGCDHRFLRVWVKIYDLAHYARRTGVPKGAGDDGIIRNFDEFTPARSGRGWDSWVARTFTVRAVDSPYSSELGRYVNGLKKAATRPFPGYKPGTSEEPRESLVGAIIGEPSRGSVDMKALQQIRNLHVSVWADVGPWC